MTSIRKIMTAFFLGLVLALSTAAFAQNAMQGSNDKKESCCVMPDCCCNGDSCPMKNGKEGKNSKEGKSCCSRGDKSADKKDDCCGDSCDMKDMKSMKDKQKQG
jgi:hypothetical protein